MSKIKAITVLQHPEVPEVFGLTFIYEYNDADIVSTGSEADMNKLCDANQNLIGMEDVEAFKIMVEDV